MTGDIEAAHYYHMEEELHQQRAERATGITTMVKGVFIIAAALLLLFARWFEFFLILIIIGALFMTTGAMQHARYGQKNEQQAENARKKAQHINVRVHHVPARPHHIVTRPYHLLTHAIRRGMPFPFSLPELSEQELATNVIRENSGCSISTLYRLYQLEGGKLDHKGFAKALHELRKSGFIRVQKHINFVDADHVSSKSLSAMPSSKKGMS